MFTRALQARSFSLDSSHSRLILDTSADQLYISKYRRCTKSIFSMLISIHPIFFIYPLQRSGQNKVIQSEFWSFSIYPDRRPPFYPDRLGAQNHSFQNQKCIECIESLLRRHMYIEIQLYIVLFSQCTHFNHYPLHPNH